jgi:hypothetical protein
MSILTRIPGAYQPQEQLIAALVPDTVEGRAAGNRCDGDHAVGRVHLKLVTRFPTQCAEQRSFVDATGTIDTCCTDEQRVWVVEAWQVRRRQRDCLRRRPGTASTTEEHSPYRLRHARCAVSCSVHRSFSPQPYASNSSSSIPP